METYNRNYGRYESKIQKRLWLSELIYKFKQYGAETSLHGFHHITDEGSSNLKRLSFSIICGFSIIFCVYLIWLQLQRYEMNIVTTSLTSTAYPIWEVPFPSVVICNYNVVYKSSATKLTKSLKFNGVPEPILTDFFLNLSSLINLDESEEMANYSGIYKTLNRFGYDTNKLMRQLNQPCDKMLKTCYWKTKEVPCLNLFKEVRTSYGFCCGFNQKGFFEDQAGDTTILSRVHEYAMGAGPAFGLRVVLDPEQEEYLSSLKSVVGFCVAVMPSIFFPQMESYGNTLLQADEMTLYLKPTVITTESEVRKLNVKTRDCFFENEGNLTWNKKYTFHTCLLECKAKAILELCNCIPYYYPHKVGTPVCTFENIHCLKQNEYKYNSLAVKATAKEPESNSFEKKKCVCYPECDAITYDYYADTAKATPVIGYSTSNVTNISILTVYFKNIECMKMERNVYLTWDSLLASIGGIFGLCLGGSVLSVIECIYYIFKTIQAPLKKECHKSGNRIHNLQNRKIKSALKPNANFNTVPSIAIPQQYHVRKHHGKKSKSKTEEFLTAFRN